MRRDSLAEIDSLASFISSTRDALTRSGLERCEHEGSVYWRGGRGERTLVLLHGVNDQAGTWASVAYLLAREHRLLILDLAGHGESEPRSGPLMMSDILGRLNAVLDHEKAAKVILVGNSMGAWLSILYTLENPQRVDRLVLEAGGGLALPLTVPLIATDREQALMILRAVHGPDAVIPEWAIEALMARSVAAPLIRMAGTDVAEYFVDERLGDVTAPTTVIWGEHDGVISRQYAEAVTSGIRGSRLVVIDDAAHIPHIQQPGRFVECLNSIF